MALYWLGAPGVDQLEYPPDSGDFYNVGDLIPGMSEAEARALTPLGHSFEQPNVFPYGTPYMEMPTQTMRRVGPALRTGEPTGSEPGTILSGPAPQAMWAQPEPPPVTPPGPPAGTLIAGPASQGDWAYQEPEELIARAVSTGTISSAEEEPAPTEPETIATAIATPELEPGPDPELQPDAEPAAEPEPELEELPDFDRPEAVAEEDPSLPA